MWYRIFIKAYGVLFFKRQYDSVKLKPHRLRKDIYWKDIRLVKKKRKKKKKEKKRKEEEKDIRLVRKEKKTHLLQLFPDNIICGQFFCMWRKYGRYF